MAEVKSLSYGSAVIALREAKAKGAHEAIYVDNKSSVVYEGTGSNIFAVKGGTLITPIDGILFGVMRGIVLELAAELGISVEQREIGYKELISADEIFMTSSVKRILPVCEVDGTLVATAVGPITVSLMKALKKHVLNQD
jgi:branched-chain amino acid aminotransferase